MKVDGRILKMAHDQRQSDLARGVRPVWSVIEPKLPISCLPVSSCELEDVVSQIELEKQKEACRNKQTVKT